MKIYCGYVSSLDNLIEKEIFTADIDSIDIIEDNDYYFEVDGYYFTSKNYSTKYIEKGILDKELKLNNGVVIYSVDKQKCIDFVNKEVNKIKEKITRLNDTICSLQITCDE